MIEQKQLRITPAPFSARRNYNSIPKLRYLDKADSDLKLGQKTSALLNSELHNSK